MIGVSVTPEMDEAVRRHAARLKISLTEFIRGLISAELRRAGVDTAPLVARLGEGQGRRSDFDDERRGRALAQLADARKSRREKRRCRMIERFSAERALPAPHCCAPSKPKKKRSSGRCPPAASAASPRSCSRSSTRGKTMPLPGAPDLAGTLTRG